MAMQDKYASKIPLTMVLWIVFGLIAAGWTVYSGGTREGAVASFSLFAYTGIALACGLLLLQQREWGHI